MVFFFFFKQKTAYEISACLVGSEMCIRDRRVTLGSGQGQNWWCVLFPQLCLAVSSEGVEAQPAEVPDLTWDTKRIFSQWLIFPV